MNVAQPTENTGEVFQPDAGIADEAAAVDKTIKENLALSEQNKPTGGERTQHDAGGGDAGAGDGPAPAPVGGERPAWLDEPLSRFKLDDSGKVRMRRNGKPIRKGGGRPTYTPAKPGEPKAADALPDELRDRYATADVVDPVAVEARRIEPGDGGGGEANGPDAAEVLADLADNTAEALRGKRARMRPSEKELIGKSARTITRGRSLWAPLALMLAVGAWVLRVWMESRDDDKSGKSEASSERHAQDDNRPVENGENDAGEADRGGGAAWFPSGLSV